MESEDFVAAVSDLEDYFTLNSTASAGVLLTDLTPEARLGLRLEPGRRVRDLTTGGFGNVVSGTRQYVLIQRP